MAVGQAGHRWTNVKVSDLSASSRRAHKLTERSMSKFDRYMMKADGETEWREAIFNVADTAYTVRVWMEDNLAGNYTGADVVRMAELVMIEQLRIEGATND